MTHRIRLATCAVALALGAIDPLAAIADGSDTIQHVCSIKTRGPYGFQCQGSADVGGGMGPATFVGTAAGSDSGFFDVTGTFTTPGSSLRVHAKGQAGFQDDTCFGHIQYQQLVLLPDGRDGPQLPSLDIDFAVVEGGLEILGTPNSLGGVPGNVFMSCRLVKAHGHE
jgi:hypothetical protein